MFLWMMSTKEGLTFDFYTTGYDDSQGSPLTKVKGFDCGKFWSIDAGANSLLFSTYQTDPEDNSFVLIPKSSVSRVWAKEVTAPKQINKISN